jgi:hypothetical protein
MRLPSNNSRLFRAGPKSNPFCDWHGLVKRLNRSPAMYTRRELVRRYAYRCVGAAVRNRQNQLRPSSLLRPVATRRVQNTTHLSAARFTSYHGNLLR